MLLLSILICICLKQQSKEALEEYSKRSKVDKKSEEPKNEETGKKGFRTLEHKAPTEEGKKEQKDDHQAEEGEKTKETEKSSKDSGHGNKEEKHSEEKEKTIKSDKSNPKHKSPNGIVFYLFQLLNSFEGKTIFMCVTDKIGELNKIVK